MLNPNIKRYLFRCNPAPRRWQFSTSRKEVTYHNNWTFMNSSVRPSDIADVADDSYGSVGGMKRILLHWNKTFRSILEESREWLSKAVPVLWTSS